MPWQVINDNVEIDTSLITCAEYQLFIDYQRKTGENPQPFHWTSRRFVPGTAKLPVTGVKGSNAQAFCAWLTEQYSLGFKYRLPRIDEVKICQLQHNNIGYWCTNGINLELRGIADDQWHNWHRSIFYLLEATCANDFIATLKLFLDFVCTYDIDLILILDRLLVFSRLQGSNNTVARVRNHSLVRVRELARHQGRELSREVRRVDKIAAQFDPSLIFDSQVILSKLSQLASNLDRDLVFDSDLVLDIDLIRDIDLTNKGNLIIDLDLAHQLASNREYALIRARELARLFSLNLAGDLLKDLTASCNLDKVFALSLDLDLHLVRDLDHEINLALERVRSLKQSRTRYVEQILECSRYLGRDLNLVNVRYYLLLIAGCWLWLSDIYKKLSINQDFLLSNTASKKYQNLSHEYLNKRNDILNIYGAFVLLEEKKTGRIPAWEGIRLVREKI